MRRHRLTWYERLETRRCLTAISFAERTIEPAEIGSGALNVTPGDIDSDGDVDLLVASNRGFFDGQLSWLENTSDEPDGWISHPIGAPSRSTPLGHGIALGDLDGDGDLDAIAATSVAPANIVWHENLDGNGLFGAARDLGSVRLNSPADPQVVDLDGDDDLDILIGSEWLENIDSGGRFEKQTLQQGLGSAVDIDSDGDWDFIAVDQGNRTAMVYLNDAGWANFGEAHVIEDVWIDIDEVHAKDVDGDGDNDLVLAGRDIVWSENLGGEGFGPRQLVDGDGGTRYRIELADVDGDGDVDVMAASTAFGPPVAWYQNAGDGSFSNPIELDQSQNSLSRIVPSDVDGNGTIDLILGGQGALNWFSNSGDGTFTKQSPPIAASLPGIVSPISDDIDGDGDWDVVLGNVVESSIVWYENSGDQWSQRPVAEIREAEGILHVATSDVDGDNDVDIIGSFFDRLVWLENVDAVGGEFVPHQVHDAQSISAMPGDMDSDGDIDLVAWTDGTISWFENTDGLGTFGPQQTLLDARSSADRNLLLADLDGNNQLDIVVHSSANDLFGWLRNNDHANSFELVPFPGRRVGRGVVSALDFDGDNDIDVLLDDVAFLNDGLGNFDARDVITGATSIVGALDLDRDGDLDLVTRTNSDVRWRENVEGRFVDRSALVPGLGFNGTAYIASVDPADSGNLLIAREGGELTWIDFVSVPGDVNDDGVFDSSDLVAALAAGQYDDDEVGNSTFQTGDWNGDGEFDSSDLVLAFQFGYAGGNIG